ncbi:hypothetical protein BY996DRAFT_6545039 [Phakopsora pachyrhizi]|nr:hypothetical protein BY996DRAFT_6545039 [Phakopsora pachyrhizi]
MSHLRGKLEPDCLKVRGALPGDGVADPELKQRLTVGFEGALESYLLDPLAGRPGVGGVAEARSGRGFVHRALLIQYPYKQGGGIGEGQLPEKMNNRMAKEGRERRRKERLEARNKLTHTLFLLPKTSIAVNVVPRARLGIRALDIVRSEEVAMELGEEEQMEGWPIDGGDQKEEGGRGATCGYGGGASNRALRSKSQKAGQSGDQARPGEILPGVQKTDQIFDSCPGSRTMQGEGRAWKGSRCLVSVVEDLVKEDDGKEVKGGLQGRCKEIFVRFCWQTLGGGTYQAQSIWSKTTGATDFSCCSKPGSTTIGQPRASKENGFNLMTYQSQYGKAKKESSSTGFGLTEEGQSKVIIKISKKLNFTCPCYEQMDHIFGSLLNFNPLGGGEPKQHTWALPQTTNESTDEDMLPNLGESAPTPRKSYKSGRDMNQPAMNSDIMTNDIPVTPLATPINSSTSQKTSNSWNLNPNSHQKTSKSALLSTTYTELMRQKQIVSNGTHHFVNSVVT